MKGTSLLLLITLICKLTFAQVDLTKTDTTKSVYKGLATRKFYSVRYSSSSTNGVTTYKLNDKEVSKSTYDKYNNTWENMETCKPCILMTYDMNDKLLFKGIQYTDCAVGFWIEYYPNGKVKLIGHYKENITGDWTNAWERGFCSREDGVFTYYNDNGEELYSEYWKDGQFIKQVPEQSKTELWNVELTLDGVKVDKQVLTPKQVSEIKITPHFKNSSTAGTNITIKVIVSAVGHKQIEQSFTIDNFKTVDIQKMFDDAGIKSSETASCNLMIYNNAVNVFNYWLTVKQ
jgi:antitoxin component YwqK of YwqJK toxin-antitoxin module